MVCPCVPISSGISHDTMRVTKIFQVMMITVTALMVVYFFLLQSLKTGFLSKSHDHHHQQSLLNCFTSSSSNEKCLRMDGKRNVRGFLENQTGVNKLQPYLVLICCWIGENFLECSKQWKLEQHGWCLQVNSNPVQHLNDGMVGRFFVFFVKFQKPAVRLNERRAGKSTTY